MASLRSVPSTAQILRSDVGYQSMVQPSTDRKDGDNTEQKVMVTAKFDLSELKEFNPALVYGFDVEESVRYKMDGEIIPELAYHTAGQERDMLDAYLYAQNEILPAIRKLTIQGVTAEHLLTWLNELHSRIARTLAEDHVAYDAKAGAYVNNPVLSWHHGSDKESLFGKLVLDLTLHNLDSQSQLTMKKFREHFNIHLTMEQIKMFFIILMNIRDRVKKMIPVEALANMTEHALIKGISAELFTQYHKGFIKDNEQIKSILHVFIKFNTHPDEIPKKMIEFAQALLQDWKKCDAKDEDQIAGLARFAFYELTKVHPYFNCNGRLATCLLNIVLRSFDKPSILMRNPGDKDDPNSSYSQAIAHIDSQPKLLVQHIKNKMKAQPYSDPLKAEVVTNRAIMVDILMKIKNEFPSYDLKMNYENTIKRCYAEIYSILGECLSEQSRKLATEKCTLTFQKIYEQLRQDKLLQEKQRLGKLLQVQPGTGVVARLCLLNAGNLGVSILSREMEHQLRSLQPK